MYLKGLSIAKSTQKKGTKTRDWSIHKVYINTHSGAIVTKTGDYGTIKKNRLMEQKRQTNPDASLKYDLSTAAQINGERMTSLVKWHWEIRFFYMDKTESGSL